MLNNPLELKVIELVGLEKGEYGRTCGLHAYCGQQVVPGTVLGLHFTEISIMEEIHVERVISSPESPQRKGRGRPKKKPTEMVTENRTIIEKVVEARVWNNQVSSCLVGFVSKPFIAIYGDQLEGRIVKIRDLDSNSNYETVRQRSKELSGLAVGIIIG
jgi:hypothetical protein